MILWNLNFIDQCIQKGLLAAFIATYMFLEENGMTSKDIQKKYGKPLCSSWQVWLYTWVGSLQFKKTILRFLGVWRMDSLESELNQNEVSVTAQHRHNKKYIWLFEFFLLPAWPNTIIVVHIGSGHRDNKCQGVQWILFKCLRVF